MAELIECTAESYHARDERSNSQLKDFLASPHTFHAAHIAKTKPKKESSAMELGTVVHKAILESKDIRSLVKQIPDSVLAKDGSKRGKAFDDWSETNIDKIQLKAEEVALVEGMFDAVYAHEHARKLLLAKGRIFEATVLWDSDGYPCRSRMDLLIPRFVVDLKTTRDVTPYGFAKAIAEYRHHQGSAFYIDAAKSLDGEERQKLFILVENVVPHRVAIYRNTMADVNRGRSMYKWALDDIARRMESGAWLDDFEAEPVNTVSAPAWFREPELTGVMQ